MSETAQPRSPKRRPGVTVRAIVFHHDHVLLLHAEDPGRPWYFLPGGHVDHGESLEDALRREVREETGVSIIVERPLYLREFIAARHTRRSRHMPPSHHTIGLLFLARPDPVVHGERPPDAIGCFPGDTDGSGACLGMEWVPRARVGDIEIMPPHVQEALLGDFPPPPRAGVAYWPEE